MRIIRFGAYTFPDTIPASGEIVRTNFGNAVPRIDRLPGMDGGYDAFGDEAAPTEVGNVRCRFALVANSAAALAGQIDAARGMSGYGRAQLVIETGAGDERWTWAKVNSLTIPTEQDAIADRYAEVTVDFQCALPRWFSSNGDSPQVEVCSGAATPFTVRNGGNAIALPRFSIDPGTAISSSGLTIQRLVDAVVVDEVEFAAAVLTTDTLVIDAQGLTVRKNGVDAYGSSFSARHPAWFRLHPGDNTVRVILGAGESASVTVTWDDTWY
ncbi:MAG: hypothetical protein IPK19_19335 [Chloroflexi bacterium]|nr:hypothetical protein [Chloroflexota bacterium]